MTNKSDGEDSRRDKVKPASVPPTVVPSLQITQAVSIPLKYICLGVLVIQMSVTVLTLRYSRANKKPGEKAYVTSTAILLSEILKIVISIFMLVKDARYDVTLFSNRLYVEVKDNWRDGMKLLIPALMYVIQNNLLFIALSNLDAATYQVTYQLKILTTALFSVCMLKKQLNPMKWFSLLVLMFGVILVQWPTETAAPPVVKTTAPPASTSSQFVGLVCVLAACMSSGFTGVYFEMLLKGSSVSLWMRNLQLAFFSILIAAVSIVVNEAAKIEDGGFFQGYNGVVWTVVILQGCGGLLVGAVVKYADNILKGFATSVSIVLSSVISYYFLGDFNGGVLFLIGSAAVLSSTYLYSLPAPVPATTAGDEKK